MSCSDKRSNNPNEVYRLWSYEDPPKEVKVLKGKYWESAHITKEYVMYLELQALEGWRKGFIKKNKLILDTAKMSLPSDAPKWFQPSKDSRIWKPFDFDQGSRYFEDTVTQKFFIYEIQL